MRTRDRSAHPPFGPHHNTPDRLRRQVQQCHTELDRAASGWLTRARYSGVSAGPVRLYVHALCIEDVTVQSLLRREDPLFTWLWADRVGPADAAAIGQYCVAVRASTGAYLAELSLSGLTPLVDLERLGVGRRTASWVLHRFVVVELERICREIGQIGEPPAAERRRTSRASPLRTGSQRVARRLR